MLIGDEIKRMRIERGMTQQELSDMSNVSRAYISNIESNKQMPRMNTITALLNGMGVEMKIQFIEVVPVNEIERLKNKKGDRSK